MTDKPTPHATTADIQAILAARKSALIEQVTPASIPALPPKKTEMKVGSQTATVTKVQDLPATQPASVPAVAPAPVPTVSDADVTAFLNEHLPHLIQTARALVEPPFKFGEVVDFGVAVSEAVKEGLPQMKGMEARALVVVIVRYVWRTYATPLLPALARPFAGALETLIISGIEAGYQLVVKKEKK